MQATLLTLTLPLSPRLSACGWPGGPTLKAAHGPTCVRPPPVSQVPSWENTGRARTRKQFCELEPSVPAQNCLPAPPLPGGWGGVLAGSQECEVRVLLADTHPAPWDQPDPPSHMWWLGSGPETASCAHTHSCSHHLNTPGFSQSQPAHPSTPPHLQLKPNPMPVPAPLPTLMLQAQGHMAARIFYTPPLALLLALPGPPRRGVRRHNCQSGNRPIPPGMPTEYTGPGPTVTVDPWPLTNFFLPCCHYLSQVWGHLTEAGL